MQPTHQDRFLTAMKFSIWAWALYWPGGGLLLAGGGLGWAAVLITLGTAGVFVGLLATGALQPSRSHRVKQFITERPLYLLVLLLGMVVASNLASAFENPGLFLFASIYLAGLSLTLTRLVQWMRATGENPFQARTDQTFIVVGMALLGAFFIWLDATLPLLGGSAVGGTSTTVILVNWVSLLYPPLLMVATRPFRDRLVLPRVRVGVPERVDQGPIVAS